MTILDKIRTAKTKCDLNLLTTEIILSPNYKENCEEFKKKLNELEKLGIGE